MIENITLKIGEKEIVLTLEEARVFYGDLYQMFGPRVTVYPTVPTIPPYPITPSIEPRWISNYGITVGKITVTSTSKNV